MKLGCHIPNEQFDMIYPYIDCLFANPIDEEYILYDPSDRCLLMLALWDIHTYACD